MTNSQISMMLESLGNQLDVDGDDMQGYVAGILFCVAASVLDGSLKELAILAFGHAAKRLDQNIAPRN